MPGWLAITLAVSAPVLSFAGTLLALSFFVGRRVAILETTQAAHTKALEALPDALKAFVTQETGKGYQAQLDRLERNDAECEGKMGGMRQEMADRVERLGARLAAHEQTQSSQTADLRAGLSRVEATVQAGLQSLKESLERIHQDRAQAPPQAPDFLSQLEQFARLQKMLKGAAT